MHSFSPKLFEQGKYFLPFTGEKMRHGDTPEVPGRAKDWTYSSPGHLSPSPRSHKPPLNLQSKGSGFSVLDRDKGNLSFSAALRFYPIYFFILQGQAVLWTRQESWREYFSSALFRAFLMDCTRSFVNEQGLQNAFCLGQWNSWGQPCHSVSLTLSLPYLYLGFSFSFSLCCLGYMGTFLILC